MDRLRDQLTAFKPVCVKVIAALAPKWNQELPTLAEPRKGGGVLYRGQYTETQQIIRDVGGIETWTVDAATGTIDETSRDYSKRQPWAHELLDMLWREELIAVASRHRCYVSGRSVTHTQLRDACEELMTGREVRQAVCRALRARSAFDKMSDAAIAA